VSPSPARTKSAAKPKAAPKPRSAKSKSKSACLIVGYDGSATGRAAAVWAAEVLPADGRIVLVHASRPLHAPTSPLASPSARREFGRALIDELLLEGPKPLLEREVLAEVSDKDPVRALTAAARRHGANGIVVGSEPHSRLRKAIGTVTSELLSSSPVPVTAVPRQSARTRPAKRS
jgi:nucleotide-binding universal stress UspA family protein